MATLNYQLFRSTPPEKYATMFLGCYDATARVLTYSNAGHLPPFLLSRDGSVQRLETSGTVVGLFDGMTYGEELAWTCIPGDIFVAYSDGITEPENEFGEFGEERLIELIPAASRPIAGADQRSRDRGGCRLDRGRRTTRRRNSGAGAGAVMTSVLLLHLLLCPDSRGCDRHPQSDVAPNLSTDKPPTSSSLLTVAGAWLRLSHLGAKASGSTRALQSLWPRIRGSTSPGCGGTGKRSLQTIYFLLMRGWVRSGRASETWLRLPSALFGIASIPLLYFVARRFMAWSLRCARSRSAAGVQSRRTSITRRKLAATRWQFCWCCCRRISLSSRGTDRRARLGAVDDLRHRSLLHALFRRAGAGCASTRCSSSALPYSGVRRYCCGSLILALRRFPD